MKLLLILCSIALSMPAVACNQPIQKQGNSCPLGYYASNGYCVPNR